MHLFLSHCSLNPFSFLWSWNHSGYFWHYPFSCLSLCFLWFVRNTAAKNPSQHLVLSFLYLPYQIQAFRFQLQKSTPLACTYISGFSLADGVVWVLYSKCPVSESFSECSVITLTLLFPTVLLFGITSTYVRLKKSILFFLHSYTYSLLPSSK